MARLSSEWNSTFILIDNLDDSGLEAVSSMQGVATVFREGSDDEVSFMLSEVPRLARTCPDGLFDTVLPALCTNLPIWEHKLLLRAATELRWLCLNTNLPVEAAKAMALCCVEVLFSVNDFAENYGRELFNAYGDVLCKSLSLAKWTMDDCQKIFMAADQYAISEAADERLLAVKVLRGLSRSDCPEGCLDASILPRVWKMLPDREVYITGNIIATLTRLASHFSRQKFFDRLWPKILRLWHSHRSDNGYEKSTAISATAELLRDSEARVFDDSNEHKLVEFFQYVSYYAYRQTKEDVKNFSNSQYECFMTVSTELPHIMTHLSTHGGQNWQKEGMKAFVALSNCKDGGIRALCASNLVTVCNAYRGKGLSSLTRVAHSFSDDESLDARRNFAAVFSDVLPVLATPNSVGGFRRMLQGQLEDRRREVRIAALENLGTSLKTLDEIKNGRAAELRLGRLLVDLSNDSDWRTQEKLAEQLGAASKMLSCQQREEVLPLVTRLFQYGSNRVRRSAGFCTLKIIRTIRPVKERCDIIASFIEEFSGQSCALRVSLVEILFGAVEIFSAYAFEQMFARHLFRLCRDPVSNVRLKMATNLHRVAVPCHSLQEYRKVIHALKNDQEQDVRQAMDGFGERAATVIQKYRTHSKRDAKKLAFERWMYKDQFSWDDHGLGDETDGRVEEQRSQNKPSKRSLSNAFTKVRDFVTKSKRKLLDQVGVVGVSMRCADPHGSVSAEEGSCADRKQRLQDKGVRARAREFQLDGAEEVSFSSASVDEALAQRFSSAESSVRTSAVTLGSQVSGNGRLQRDLSSKTGTSEAPVSSHFSSTISSGSVWSRKYFGE